MYAFLTGPMLWISLAIFFAGIIVKTILYIKGLDTTLDRVTYRVNTMYGIRGAIRSIFYWLFPFATHSWRTQPGITVLFFVFHTGIILTPLFLKAHQMILKESFGIYWFSMPDAAADLATIAVLISGLFLLLRRISLPEVRLISKAADYLVWLIAVTPFWTGILAYHQIGDYSFWLNFHILSGEIMLIAVPLTKLSHSFLFFLSRAQIGFDYGIKRGGMKTKKGMAW